MLRLFCTKVFLISSNGFTRLSIFQSIFLNLISLSTLLQVSSLYPQFFPLYLFSTTFVLSISLLWSQRSLLTCSHIIVFCTSIINCNSIKEHSSYFTYIHSHNFYNLYQSESPIVTNKLTHNLWYNQLSLNFKTILYNVKESENGFIWSLATT